MCPVNSASQPELNQSSAVLFRPTVSVITITYNAAAHLEQTIQSVAAQTYPRLEYIIVDGKSTDGTCDIIRQHDSLIDRWISEPDNGIADAMNKGLALATGALVLFLHADDYFAAPDSLARCIEQCDAGCDIYACNILYATEHGLIERRSRGWGLTMFLKTGVYHQGALCWRDLLQRLDGFDTQFRIVMDYDFFLRAYRSGATLQKIDRPLSVMRDTGVSSRTDWPSLKSRFLEERRVHWKSCRGPISRLLLTVYWCLYLPYRRLRCLLHTK